MDSQNLEIFGSIQKLGLISEYLT